MVSPGLGRRAARLFAREALLRSIVETVPDAMIVIDEGGHVLSFSAAAERMFGYLEEEALDKNVSMFMPSPDRERHDGYLERYMRTGERRIIGIGRVLIAKHRNGDTFPIELTVGEAWIGPDRVFTGFIRDLTERQQVELRVHELQSELAHVSRVSAMGTLATSMAHELNQPLTAIANYVETAVELLARDPSEESLEMIRDALSKCAEQSVRAGQIVRRLRDFILRGETERRVESLQRLVTEASALALLGGGGKDVEVDVRLDPSADLVLVDRIQIQQVLLNLIRNAIEAMAKQRDPTLLIYSEREAEGFVRITVADNGPGFSSIGPDQFFEPFRSTKEGGMGMGLSISATIISAHGGRIWAEPSKLGGAAFHFTVMEADSEESGA